MRLHVLGLVFHWSELPFTAQFSDVSSCSLAAVGVEEEKGRSWTLKQSGNGKFPSAKINS